MKKNLIRTVAAAFLLCALAFNPFSTSAELLKPSDECPNGCVDNGNGCYCNGWYPCYAEA